MITVIIIEKERLSEIHEELLFSGFPESKWFTLGMRLGLKLQTLKAIESDHVRDGASRCLTECLEKWLSKADNLIGPLSWVTLADALRRVGEISASEKINKCE